MHVERFAPADDKAAVRTCYEIYLAGVTADDPCGPPMSARCFAGWLELGWTEDPSETWLARDGTGEACGWYVLGLPGRENRHLARLTPVVHPARRRAGLGTALVRHAAQRAHHLGRSVLSSESRQGSPGSAFAHALGSRQGITQVRRVLEVAAVTPGRRAELRAAAQAASSGYVLLSWLGQPPPEQLAGIAVVNAAVADMPHEAGHEAQRWSTERVLQDARRVAAQGLRYYTVAAQSLATGELAGLSQLGVEPDEPTWGHQELTVVSRPHRGHRLGMLLKVAMLDLLAEHEPQLTRIITGNADQNQHMIAINEALGFAAFDRWPSWEIGVAQVLARPGQAAP
jgi:GNAT superfamily N-acetyltransferase/RimJ/RimL family protein N-acetyltransferase